jgi:Neuraminidase (sialidase)
MLRRDFMKTGLALAAAPPRAEIGEAVTISMRPEFYHGWATVARRASGELFAVCSGGRESHICPFGWVELMRSTDDGATWSWPQVLMDTPIDDRDAGICETARGTLLVTTFTSLAYERSLPKVSGERRARWDALQRRTTAAERQKLLGCWMLRSTDGGLTWSAPYRVPVNSPHGPVRVSGNRLLYAGKALWETPQRVGVCESTDDGVTWRWLAGIPARPGDTANNYHELHAVEAAPGRIVVHIRNHNTANAGETLQTESADEGKTWSVPHPIGVWGLPSHLLRLADGRLLMSYGHRRAPIGNQARVSEDAGRTWSEPVAISSAASPDVGYPASVQLGDGNLLTVWYELMPGSPRAVLRQARWRLG